MTSLPHRLLHLFSVFPLLFFFTLALPAAAQAQPVFTAGFAPDTIGPGSDSTVTFTIDNSGSGSPVSDLAFTGTLPAGMTIAAGSASDGCSMESFSAPAGGSTITASGGKLGAGAFCQISVPVTASTPGTYSFTTGDLTSSAGNSGPASDDLTVNASATGFSTAFSQASVDPGSVARLTYTLDNSLNGSNFNSGRFTSTLPAGLVLASPPQTASDCPASPFAPQITAVSGGSSVAASFLSVTAGTSCTVSVDVKGLTQGTHTASSELFNNFGQSQGTAAASLTVNSPPADGIGFTKAFGADQANAGGTVALTFSLANVNRSSSAASIAFTDNLDDFLSGATLDSLAANSCGGSASGTGSGLLSFSGGSLAAGETCAITVNVALPAGAGSGTYTNTTSALTADLGGSPYTGGTAATTLRVLANGAQPPALSKEFTDDPVAPGGNVTVRYTLTNPNSSDAVSDIAFTDDVPFPGATFTTLPAANSCGSGSTFTLNTVDDVLFLNVGDGGLAAGASCTFDAVLTVAADVAPGSYSSTTSAVTATVNAASVTGTAAAAGLVVEGNANLSFVKSFDSSPAASGSTAGLTFAISSAAESASTATGIAFSDDLNAFLAGTTLDTVTANTCGGSLTGSSSLSYSGGSLAPGESCEIAMDIALPAGAVSGTYTNTTSALTATAGGTALSISAASADLQVLAGGGVLETSKSFAPASVRPGGSVTLTYTLTNTGTLPYTGVFFTESYSSALSGLAASVMPAGGFCGSGSAASGTTFGIFTGLEIAAGASCSFDVVLDVPAGAADGDYNTLSSSITASLNGGTVSLPAMSANLSVSGSVIGFEKTTLSSSVTAGGTLALQYRITNPSSTSTLSSIAFSDDLDAVLTGLSATGLPSSTCGGTLSGTTVLSFSGGSLAPGASCDITATLQTSASATPGNYSIPGSTATGTLDSAPVTGSTAAAEFSVLAASPPGFTKAFADANLGAGASTTLTYVISNPGSSTLDGLRFSDDLDAMLSGLAVTGGTGSGLCGAGSTVTGGSSVQLSNGQLAAGASCTITLNVAVPAAAAPGSYSGSSSSLTANGSLAAAAASAGFAVEPAPSFAQSFAPGGIAAGGTATLTLTVDNSAAAIAASALDTTLNLPAGLVLADPVNASASCIGGTLTAPAGSSVISYTGGQAGAGASCTVAVDVTAATAGSYVSTTGDLTSSLGNSGSASSTLRVADITITTPFAAGPVINAAGAGSFAVSGTTALIADGQPVTVTVSDGGGASTSGGTTVSSGAWSLSLDVSGLADGTLTVAAATQEAGGPAAPQDSAAIAKDAAAPAGHSAALDQDPVNAANETAASFTFAGAEPGADYAYSITSDGGGSPVAGSGTIATATDQVTGLDLSGLSDGTLTLTVTLTDAVGNAGAAATDTAAKDTAAPAGYSAALDQDPVNTVNETAASFTFAGAEPGADYAYSITSDGGGSPVAGSGTIATATDQITGLDLSGLGSGTLTLTVTLTDAAGNAGAAATDTAAKDTMAPSVAFDSPLAGDGTVNASEAAAAAISGITGDIPDGTAVTIVATDTAAASVSGSATASGNAWSLNLDVSSLADGTLSLTADTTNAAGNPAPQASATLVKDTAAPAGYSAALDQDPVNTANETAASFTFAGAEPGADYAYSITSDGGGSPVAGSGTIATATDQVTGLDLSGLGDGTLTLTVTLTDAAGNAGSPAAGTATKGTTRPSVTLAGPDSAQSDPFEVTAVFSETVTGFALSGLTLDNGTASGLTGSGTDYSFTVTPDHDGTVSITVNDGAGTGASGNSSTESSTLEITAALTGTPDPNPGTDSDGDGIPDSFESATADRDGDGIPDAEDYDPQGYFYCEDDGRIMSGGSITVTGPSGSNSSVGIANDINIVRDGSSGEYQWFALRPGTYTVSYGYPADGGAASTARLSSGSLDVTSLLPANPAVIGSTQTGASGFLADASLAANPAFYDSFVIEAGDPNVLANNIPMTQCAENAVAITAVANGAEANGGTPVAAGFTLAQARISAVDTVISYTAGGTATAGDDYTALAGTATIAAGATSATVEAAVLEDILVEGSETIEVTLTAVVSGDQTTILSTAAADLAGTASIADDDFAGVAVTNDDLTASENGDDTAAMSFSLLGQPGADVVLSFSGDSQCTVSPASMTFTSSDFAAAQVLTIHAVDDDLVEGTHSCQPAVAVTSADTSYDGYALTLAQVAVSDDLVDQVRNQLTEVLKQDLENTVQTQSRYFSRMSKGALERLRAGSADLRCGTLSALDADGSVQLQDGTGSGEGTFGWDVFKCSSGSREILDGNFSVSRNDAGDTQALIQFARQSERFLAEEQRLRGSFWGGYLSRSSIEGLADGSINGFGINTGIYGAREIGSGVFLDYYAAGGLGHHSYKLRFDAQPSQIEARGDYSYAAAYAGAAVSGQRSYERLTVSPRLGVSLAYAAASDSDVTATQMAQSDTGSIDIPSYNGGRLFAEVELTPHASTQMDAAGNLSLVRFSFTPRLACEASSYDSSADCGAGFALSREVFNPASGLSFGFEIDYEHLSGSDRLALEVTRERPFANGQGAVVTRLSLPSEETLAVEHGIQLDF